MWIYFIPDGGSRIDLARSIGLAQSEHSGPIDLEIDHQRIAQDSERIRADHVIVFERGNVAVPVRFSSRRQHADCETAMRFKLSHDSTMFSGQSTRGTLFFAFLGTTAGYSLETCVMVNHTTTVRGIETITTYELRGGLLAAATVIAGS